MWWILAGVAILLGLPLFITIVLLILFNFLRVNYAPSVCKKEALWTGCCSFTRRSSPG